MRNGVNIPHDYQKIITHIHVPQFSVYKMSMPNTSEEQCENISVISGYETAGQSTIAKLMMTRAKGRTDQRADHQI